jgi:predicted RNase H-like nuclease
MPTHLLVGFDSAWTRKKSGALAGAVREPCGGWTELGIPLKADFPTASQVIRGWIEEVAPDSVVVMLDQPTIVQNSKGQRPVENLVAGPVSRAYGGVQPANRGRVEMFGVDAPVWEFLDEFGGPADLLQSPTKSWVIETYPALALLSLGWALPDPKREFRLPKYNPARRKTFRVQDWVHVCRTLGHDLWSSGLHDISDWLSDLEASEKPRKTDQDGVDACLCLAIGIRLIEGGRCLMVGDNRSGYILVPWSETLESQIEMRCEKTGRSARDWVRTISVEWSLG